MLDIICTRKEKNTGIFIFQALQNGVENIWIWGSPPIVRKRVVSPEAQTPTNRVKITALLRTFSPVNACKISFAQEKKKTWVFLFFELYKMVLKMFESEDHHQ